MQSDYHGYYTAEKEFNDNLAHRYFDIWDTYPIQRFTDRIESRILSHQIPPNAKVVLLGSGGGREIPALLALQCALTAVDISPNMIEAGKARYPNAGIRWIEADLHALPSDIGTDFDAAVCLGGVLNYLADPTLFLANTRQLLKKGGILALAVINSKHPAEQTATTQLRDGRVRLLYDLQALRVMLEESHFDIVLERGIRYFVDLLPSDWNRPMPPTSEAAQALNQLLQSEAQLSEILSPERAKFIFLCAKRR
jgi:SAM-dependent methyltransferase